METKTTIPSVLKHIDELAGSCLLGVTPTKYYLNTSRTGIYRLIDRGLLHPLKIGGSLKFRVDELRALSAGGAQ